MRMHFVWKDAIRRSAPLAGLATRRDREARFVPNSGLCTLILSASNSVFYFSDEYIVSVVAQIS